MWLKLCGSVLIIAVSTIIGFSLAKRYSDRPRQIGQLIGCLTTLKSCINYIAMPLPEAFIHCGGQVDGPVREFFERTAQILVANGWLTPRKAIEEALGQMRVHLAFSLQEQELLLQLGANLGVTNREEQQKYLGMVLEELGRIEQESVKARDQNVKMYRYLGICGGLTVVILLV